MTANFSQMRSNIIFQNESFKKYITIVTKTFYVSSPSTRMPQMIMISVQFPLEFLSITVAFILDPEVSHQFVRNGLLKLHYL